MPTFKRPHAEVTDINTSFPASKRRSPEEKDSEAIRQGFLDALSDISDEIKFAVKCIDRAAGEETSTLTPAKLS